MKVSARPACLRCGAARPLEIIYGLVAMPIDETRFALGGCSVEEERWQCRECSFEWA